MPVMESLEIFTLPFESCITWKPLPSEKIFIIGIVETFDYAISPRLFDRDEYRGNPVVKTQSNHQTKRARIAVAAPKRQGIVQLQEIGHPHSFPATHEAVSHLPVVLGPLCLDIGLMGGHIDHVE